MIDVPNQIEATLAWREAELAKHPGRARIVRPSGLDELFTNQTRDMQIHLREDNMHRVLDRYKTSPRAARPIEAATIAGAV